MSYQNSQTKKSDHQKYHAWALISTNHFSTNIKGVINAVGKMTSIMIYNEWTYTICRRKMLQSQQQNHLIDKAHNNRWKQIFNATTFSNSSLQSIIVEDFSTIINIFITKIQKTKSKFAKTTHQSRIVKAKNRNVKDKTIEILSFQSFEIDAHSNWEYIEFEQNTRTFVASYDVTNYE